MVEISSHGGWAPNMWPLPVGLGMVRQLAGRHLGATSINLSKCVSLFTCVCIYIHTQSSICIYIYVNTYCANRECETKCVYNIHMNVKQGVYYKIIYIYNNIYIYIIICICHIIYT